MSGRVYYPVTVTQDGLLSAAARSGQAPLVTDTAVVDFSDENAPDGAKIAMGGGIQLFTLDEIPNPIMSLNYIGKTPNGVFVGKDETIGFQTECNYNNAGDGKLASTGHNTIEHYFKFDYNDGAGQIRPWGFNVDKDRAGGPDAEFNIHCYRLAITSQADTNTNLLLVDVANNLTTLSHPVLCQYATNITLHAPTSNASNTIFACGSGDGNNGNVLSVKYHTGTFKVSANIGGVDSEITTDSSGNRDLYLTPGGTGHTIIKNLVAVNTLAGTMDFAGTSNDYISVGAPASAASLSLGRRGSLHYWYVDQQLWFGVASSKVYFIMGGNPALNAGNAYSPMLVADPSQDGTTGVFHSGSAGTNGYINVWLNGVVYKVMTTA